MVVVLVQMKTKTSNAGYGMMVDDDGSLVVVLMSDSDGADHGHDGDHNDVQARLNP